tara:strand:- start:153 stop:380 length:228 start_codon:yes stop_codon:yes gene_type:complete
MFSGEWVMVQSRLESLLEVLVNTAIGFIVSFAGWPIAAWIFDMSYNTNQHIGVVLFFTVLSVFVGTSFVDISITG